MVDSQLGDLTGSAVYDSNGDKIGKVGQVYTDDRDGNPTWLSVNTGLFGTSETFLPIGEATFADGDVRVPFTKDMVKDAPHVDADGHLSPEDERQLYAYYSVDYDAASYGETTYGDPVEGTSDVSAADDDAMTRSEEKVEVGTTTQESGRARLRKYVVTENVTQTVPVRKEKAVLETEPITEANVGDAMSGPDITEDQVDVVLHEEKPVVEKTVEPVERVRLGTEEVAGEETVSEEVRKERIEAEGDIANPGDTTR
jgi:stress response protein YsnF